MSVKIVDCIILAMLREERELFLENNNCLIYDEAKAHEDFLEFKFFDKNLKLRTGVLCSGDRAMGNNEAGKLFYRLSREYASKLYINIGVAGYINDANIGDVIIVEENYSLCEKNVANSELQKTDAPIDKNFIRKTVFKKIRESYLNKFNILTQSRMRNLRIKLSDYAMTNSINEDLLNSLNSTCGHNHNTIKLGGCATYHSVVKDDGTRAEIKKIRKTNIVDMEAYYFNDWHILIKEEEKNNAKQDSKMIFVKSISDTAIENEKAILEKIDSRALAMSNIYDVVTYYISFLHNFPKKETEDLYQYFKKTISDLHTDKLIKYEMGAYNALDKLCSYLIIEEQINGKDFKGTYIDVTCELLKKENQTLVLQGRPGKGKSTFISYVYRKIEQERPAVFISIPELQNETNNTPVAVSLYLLKRLLESNKNLTVFIDGVEGSRKKTSEENEEILKNIIDILSLNDNRNISICIGAWNLECISDEDIINRISANNETTKLTFKSISSLDGNIKSFVSDFADFYKYCDPTFDIDNFVKKAMEIISNEKFQLKYVDFRLLHIFAKHKQILNRSKSIFEFINKYSTFYAENNLQEVINKVGLIISNRHVIDDSGLLTKNIYSRAYIFSKFLYQAFTTNDTHNIEIILSNQYILSDNINLFLEHLLNSDENKAKKFAIKVIEYLKKYEDCNMCSKIQLLYNVSTIKNLNIDISNSIKEYILSEIQKIDQHILDEVESHIIIGYRTLAIILNNRFKNSKYLKRFNALISASSTEENAEIVRKINKNFHLLYYSQTEFTYSKVEESNIPFEPEVLWNTYQILKRNITSEGLSKDFIETCILTIIQLIKYINEINLPLNSVLSKAELEDCLEIISNLKHAHSFSLVDEEIKNIAGEL